VRHLIDRVEQLHQGKGGFKSLRDGSIDTTTSSDEMIFHVFTTVAQVGRG
jgi:DNA invertase Pin-like site-specific DNA recombinase